MFFFSTVATTYPQSMGINCEGQINAIALNKDSVMVVVAGRAGMFRPPTENYFSYFSTNTFVVGTQKNRLYETVLLSTQNKCLKLWIRKFIPNLCSKFLLNGPTYAVALPLVYR